VKEARPEGLDEQIWMVDEEAGLPPIEERELRSYNRSPAELAAIVANAAVDKKASELVVLDVSGKASYADLFVLCNGTNPRQVRAIADAMLQAIEQQTGVRPNGVEGLEASRWVLVDLGDVVAHVFLEPWRGYYDLDGLWLDGRKLPLTELGVTAPPARDPFLDDED
jgi:ribosome-associated protein